MICHVCGQAELTRVRFAPGLYECAWCGVRSTHTRPATRFDDAYYARNYEAAERSDAYALVVDRVAPLLPVGARVLDVGCGAGRLVVALRDRGFDAVDVDPSEAARRAAAKLDVDAFARIDDVRDLAPFAAVFFIDVLAHVVNAQALMSEAVSMLVPDGVVVVRTPASTRALACVEQIVTLGGRVTADRRSCTARVACITLTRCRCGARSKRPDAVL